jgi:hypothetical protein
MNLFKKVKDKMTLSKGDQQLYARMGDYHVKHDSALDVGDDFKRQQRFMQKVKESQREAERKALNRERQGTEPYHNPIGIGGKNTRKKSRKNTRKKTRKVSRKGGRKKSRKSSRKSIKRKSRSRRRMR